MRLALILLFTTLTAQAQWTIQQSGTTASLRGIHAVSDQVAWASGTSGTVLHTTDGGAHWLPCAIPPAAEHLDFRGIQAFDAQTAIVMSSGKGDLSRLYKTTDACQTWTLVFTNPDPEGFWDVMTFNLREPMSPSSDWRTLSHGYIVGDPVSGKFPIFSTITSGSIWYRWGSTLNDATETASLPKATAGEALFAASNSSAISPGNDSALAFVSGGAGGSRLFSLHGHSPFDNGTRWAFEHTKLPAPIGASAGAFSMARRELRKPKVIGTDVMIVGGDYQKPDAPGFSCYVPFRTGVFFGMVPQRTVSPTSPPHGYRSSVAYNPTEKSWITVGPNGTDLSTDDGRNWHPLRPTPSDASGADRDWNALSLPFVVGPQGRIGRLNPLSPTKTEVISTTKTWRHLNNQNLTSSRQPKTEVISTTKLRSSRPERQTVSSSVPEWRDPRICTLPAKARSPRPTSGRKIPKALALGISPSTNPTSYRQPN